MDTINKSVSDENLAHSRELYECDGITGLCLLFRDEPIQSLSDLLRMSAMVEQMRSGRYGRREK